MEKNCVKKLCSKYEGKNKIKFSNDELKLLEALYLVLQQFHFHEIVQEGKNSLKRQSGISKDIMRSRLLSSRFTSSNSNVASESILDHSEEETDGYQSDQLSKSLDYISHNPDSSDQVNDPFTEKKDIFLKNRPSILSSHSRHSAGGSMRKGGEVKFDESLPQTPPNSLTNEGCFPQAQNDKSKYASLSSHDSTDEFLKNVFEDWDNKESMQNDFFGTDTEAEEVVISRRYNSRKVIDLGQIEKDRYYLPPGKASGWKWKRSKTIPLREIDDPSAIIKDSVKLFSKFKHLMNQTKLTSQSTIMEQYRSCLKQFLESIQQFSPTDFDVFPFRDSIINLDIICNKLDKAFLKKNDKALCRRNLAFYSQPYFLGIVFNDPKCISHTENFIRILKETMIRLLNL